MVKIIRLLLAVPPEPRLTTVLLPDPNEAVTPFESDGATSAERLTEPVKPLMLVTLTSIVPFAPWNRDNELGDTLSAMSGGGTITLTSAERTNVPLVPDTVTS